MNFASVFFLRMKLRSASASERVEAIRQLRTHGEPATALLITALADPDDTVAGKAAEALGEMRTPLVLEGLQKQLKTVLISRTIPKGAASQQRIYKLVEALCQFGPAATEALLMVLDNRHAELVAQGPYFEGMAAAIAASKLKEFRDPRTVNSLIARLEDQVMGGAAASALQAFGKEVRPVLLPKLADPNPLIRANVVFAFAKVGDSTDIERILPMMEDADPDVRRQSCLTVQELGWQPQTPPDKLRVEIAMGRCHPSAMKGPEAIRPFISEMIYTLYRFKGLAKSDDTLLLQQIEWAMRKELQFLPQAETADNLVNALEALVERHGAEISEPDLKLLAKFPALKVRGTKKVVRENPGSGYEYTREEPVEIYINPFRIQGPARRLLKVEP